MTWTSKGDRGTPAPGSWGVSVLARRANSQLCWAHTGHPVIHCLQSFSLQEVRWLHLTGSMGAGPPGLPPTPWWT